MRDTYSLYEAKAKLSALIRMVREGHTIVVTLHGKPVAEMRPIESGAKDLHARLDELAERGILTRPRAEAKYPQVVARKRGALKRFLADRD